MQNVVEFLSCWATGVIWMIQGYKPLDQMELILELKI